MVYLEQVAEVQEHVCGRVKEHTAQATVAGGAGGGRAGQGLPDALRHSRSGGASGWPSAGRPACDNARSTPGASPSAAGCPWGQMDARPTGPVRALQNEQSPRAGQAARGPGAGHGAGAAPGPEATWPHRCTRIRTHPAAPPRPLRLPARRRNREHPSRVTRGSALCRPAAGAPLRTADFELCEQRPAEGWGAGQRHEVGRGPGCHRQTGGWPQCGPSTCARALRLHVLKVRIQLRQVKRTNSLL